MNLRKLTLSALALAAMALPALPSAAASTYTVCQGGATDTTLVYGLDTQSVRLYPSPYGDYYVAVADHSVWKESNGHIGLQLTDRVCTDYDSTTGAPVGSTVLWTRDTQLGCWGMLDNSGYQLSCTL